MYISRKIPELPLQDRMSLRGMVKPVSQHDSWSSHPHLSEQRQNHLAECNSRRPLSAKECYTGSLLCTNNSVLEACCCIMKLKYRHNKGDGRRVARVVTLSATRLQCISSHEPSSCCIPNENWHFQTHVHQLLCLSSSLNAPVCID